ncbi:hypothetical protein JG687_00018494, partial [Phytophthora cactorum]
ERVRARVAAANPRGEPAKQGCAIFEKAGPAPSTAACRALHSPEYPIFKSRTKRTAGAPSQAQRGRQNTLLKIVPFCSKDYDIKYTRFWMSIHIVFSIFASVYPP